MPYRKRRVKITAAHQHHQHRQLLVTVLYLCGVALVVNAWLVSQDMLDF